MEIKIELGELVGAELGQLMALYSHLNPDDEPIPGERAAAIWQQIEKNPNIRYIVARLRGQLISTCHLLTVPNFTRGGRPYALIENVVTLPQFRGQGLGEMVVRRAVELAKDADCYKVMLMTGRADEQVFKFYEKCGFERGKKSAFIIRFDNK